MRGRKWTLKIEDLPLISGGPNEENETYKVMFSELTTLQNFKDSQQNSLPASAACIKVEMVKKPKVYLH